MSDLPPFMSKWCDYGAAAGYGIDTDSGRTWLPTDVVDALFVTSEEKLVALLDAESLRRFIRDIRFGIRFSASQEDGVYRLIHWRLSAGL